MKTISRDHGATLPARTATRSRRRHTRYAIRRIRLTATRHLGRRRSLPGPRRSRPPCPFTRRKVPMDRRDGLADVPIRPPVNSIPLSATLTHDPQPPVGQRLTRQGARGAVPSTCRVSAWHGRRRRRCRRRRRTRRNWSGGTLPQRQGRVRALKNLTRQGQHFIRIKPVVPVLRTTMPTTMSHCKLIAGRPTPSTIPTCHAQPMQPIRVCLLLRSHLTQETAKLSQGGRVAWPSRLLPEI